MKFRYRKIPDNVDPKGYSLHPLVQISLRHGRKVLKLVALLDSGAADCLFHKSVGVALGMDVESGRPKEYAGIARQLTPGYVHSVFMQVQGSSEWTEIEAGFIDADLVPLLGQNGFFDNHQVIFERYRGRFEINSRTRFRFGR